MKYEIALASVETHMGKLDTSIVVLISLKLSRMFLMESDTLHILEANL